jgi:hypothetical protein
MKNLIIQINVDKSLYKDKKLTQKGPGKYGLYDTGYTSEVGKLSEASFRAYATKCGADYTVFEKPIYDWVSPSFERMRLIVEDEWANKYDNILYVDYDILCHPDTPNIFTEFPQDAIRVVNKKKLSNGNKKELRNFQKHNIPEDEFKNKFFNAGVVLFNKKGLRLLKKHEKFKERVWKWQHGCQGEINFCVMKYGMELKDMGKGWNCLIFPWQKGKAKTVWNDVNFFHFVAAQNIRPGSMRADLLKKFKKIFG